MKGSAKQKIITIPIYAHSKRKKVRYALWNMHQFAEVMIRHILMDVVLALQALLHGLQENAPDFFFF
jgi:hypothetical protein